LSPEDLKLTRPTLSVVLANYNHGHYLPQSLKALLEQSVRPDEILVVDDGSTDNSVEVIEAIARTNPLVRLLRNDRNRGFLYTVTRGVENTTGDYLFFPAADDYVLPGLVEKSMSLLAQHPQAGISCGFCSTIDGVTGEVKENAYHWAGEPTYLPPDKLAKCIGRQCIPGHNAIIKRSCFLEAGGHLPELEWISDWFMYLTAAFRHGLCFIPEKLALFRILPTSYSNVGLRDRARMIAIIHRVFDLLASPAYADLAPYFRQSGAMGQFETNLVYAAAVRADCWSSHILSLVNCLPAAEYQAALDAEDPAVQELATFFMGTLAPGEKLVRELQEQLGHTRAKLQEAQDIIACMQSTKFWKLRKFWVRSKQAVKRLAFRS
jgi:glycosyltransferase involved in cell wall biosynthesis